MDGKIIIVEGVEGVGKTSLINEMKKEYEKLGLKVDVYKFPDESSIYGETMYAMLREKKFYDAYAFQFGVIAQILSKVKEMKVKRKEGKIVLIERCFLSVIAYGYAENIDENLLTRCADEIYRILNPDAMIFLNLHAETLPYEVSKIDRYKGKEKVDLLKIINSFMREHSHRYRCFTMYVGSNVVSMANAAIMHVNVGIK